MITEILQHRIELSWEGGENHKLQESDIEHIKKCIEDGCNQGQLCQIDEENGEVENIGWWKILA